MTNEFGISREEVNKAMDKIAATKAWIADLRKENERLTTENTALKALLESKKQGAEVDRDFIQQYQRQVETLTAEGRRKDMTNGELTDALVEIRDNPRCDAPKRAADALGPKSEGVKCECGAVTFDNPKWCAECHADFSDSVSGREKTDNYDACNQCGHVPWSDIGGCDECGAPGLPMDTVDSRQETGVCSYPIVDRTNDKFIGYCTLPGGHMCDHSTVEKGQ